ncbi:unnamed protein product [Ambrosiozyma monospora]|uniref:Unnamed protein product n=1 Tax=Ambrosiozyma monospora TaxID=43982 RepID=A0ACB5UBI1_AMBMO|nr:unnamed protein product [Ambrosiozyma monospora]
MFQFINRLTTQSLKQTQTRAFSFLSQTTTPKLASTARSQLSSTQLTSSSIQTTNTYQSNIIATTFSQPSPFSLFTQLRWGTRGGNLGRTYQPNTLKRKRRLGFLARMKCKSGRNIVKARKAKGRWFLTH